MWLPMPNPALCEGFPLWEGRTDADSLDHSHEPLCAEHHSRTKGTIMTASPRRPFARKTRAILAGSLVLGVGVAVTLVSWNDSE